RRVSHQPGALRRADARLRRVGAPPRGPGAGRQRGHRGRAGRSARRLRDARRRAARRREVDAHAPARPAPRRRGSAPMNRRGRERVGSGAGGGGARFRAMVGRVFGDAENPMQWAVTLGHVAGIRVRIHVIFILYAAAQLLVSVISRDALGPQFVAISLAWLFGLVLLHEFGHCFACRAVGGEAGDILMWPLGGLASVMPPDTPRAHLITTLGGPGVTLALLPIFVAAMRAAGIGDRILFNPLALPIGGLGWGQV